MHAIGYAMFSCEFGHCLLIIVSWIIKYCIIMSLRSSTTLENTFLVYTVPLEERKTLPYVCVYPTTFKLLRHAMKLLSVSKKYAFRYSHFDNWLITMSLLDIRICSLENFLFHLMPSSKILHGFASDRKKYRLLTMMSLDVSVKHYSEQQISLIYWSE